MRKFLATLAITAMTVSPAFAGVVLDDNFDGENGGNSQLNYTAFANFDVEDGTVDLINQPAFGITCNSGSCVDLDGSTSNGATLITNQTFSFLAGQTISLFVDASGNQRNGEDDRFEFGFRSIGGDVLFNDRVVTFGSGAVINAGDFTGPETFGFLDFSADRPFEQFSFDFTAGAAGSIKAFVRTNSADNIGPIIDNFSLSISSAVPEPATWAFMIFGFGAIGGTLRSQTRRQRKAKAKVTYA
ncbi:MAG: PEPxxWA-CTERM sorting domain-containing protein [Parasphingorhabdus sp.]|uniref:PEPxxWA-CTERM sorting domain-containing protein n=1 Tax=Parasphingorhabdus sp. TaxID=2709688 RepID=UPI003297FD50